MASPPPSGSVGDGINRTRGSIEKYFNPHVSHFHEKEKREHQIDLSHTWVKAALQGAELVARARQRRVHRKRPRRPLPDMLLHIDGSRHQWFQDERWYHLIVILDDATNEIYYAQLVEEESTSTVMAGPHEMIERKGVFCAVIDRGSHFWLTPKAGGKIDPHRLTQVGRALRFVRAYADLTYNTNQNKKRNL